MTLAERIAGTNLPALLPALLAAAAAFVALFLLIERFDRIAQAKPIVGSDREWKAETGTELRLRGVNQGPLLGVETSPGGGLMVRAASARLANGGATERLNMKIEGVKDGDNKAKVHVSLVGNDGSVTLSRSGEAVMPQLRIRVEKAELKVNTSVTIGDSLEFPARTVVFGGGEVVPNGMGFSFIVPAGGTVAIEFPAFPDGTPSGVVPWLGAVREEQEDTVLPVREAGIFREGANSPDKSACAANRRYAWAPFFRPTLFPAPTGADCKLGSMTGRAFSIDGESVAVSLAGYAWHMQEGKPTASLWSWARDNPVLSLVVNWGLPAVVAWIFGLITWRHTNAATEPAEPKKVAAAKVRASRRSRPKRPQ